MMISDEETESTDEEDSSRTQNKEKDTTPRGDNYTTQLRHPAEKTTDKKNDHAGKENRQIQIFANSSSMVNVNTGKKVLAADSGTQ